jgi:hypothetical protein
MSGLEFFLGGRANQHNNKDYEDTVLLLATPGMCNPMRVQLSLSSTCCAACTFDARNFQELHGAGYQSSTISLHTRYFAPDMLL